MSQTKVEFPHEVVAGVIGPHRCEYLTNGVGVLLDQFLLGGFPLHRHKGGTDALGKIFRKGIGSLIP